MIGALLLVACGEPMPPALTEANLCEQSPDAASLCAVDAAVTQAAADPEVIANEYIVEMDHPGGGTVKVVGAPIKLSDTPAQPSAMAPELGQHTEEILLELGYEWDQIAVLGEAGAV